MGKNLIKRVLPLLLAAAMIVTSVPANVLAEEIAAADFNAIEEVTSETDVVAKPDAVENTKAAAYNANIVLRDLDDYFSVNFSTYNEIEVVNDVVVITKIKENPLDEIMETINDELNTGSMGLITIKDADGNSRTDLYDRVSLVWKEKTGEDTYTDVTGIPSKQGKFRLYISLNADGINAEEKYIDFEINKGVLELYLDSAFSHNVGSSGITAKTAIENLINNIKANVKQSSTCTVGKNLLVYADAGETEIYELDDKGTKKSISTNDILVKGKDYEVKVTFNIKARFAEIYDIVQLPDQFIHVDTLRTLNVAIKNIANGTGMPVTREYSAKGKIDAPVLEGADKEVEVIFTDPNEVDPLTLKEKVITPNSDELSYKWLDANKNEITSPEDAGSYYYRVIFNDKSGVYEETFADIPVVVNAVQLAILPKYSGKNLYAGKNTYAIDVLNEVEYQLFEKSDAASNSYNKEFKGFDKSKFFGVTYNNPDYPQSYSPIFSLEMGVGTKGDGEKDYTYVWHKVAENIPLTLPTGFSEEYNADVKYRVVFSGNKGVYFYNNRSRIPNLASSIIVDINDATPMCGDNNYVIDKSQIYNVDFIEYNVVINKPVNATINVDDMLIENKGISINSIYRKTYDHVALYTNRKEYKKAKVKISGNKVIAENTDRLTYTWYKFNDFSSDAPDFEYLRDDDGNIIFGDDGYPLIKEVNILEKFTSHQLNQRRLTLEYDKMPKDAGLYALRVQFDDPTGEYFAEDAFVFYQIEKQVVKIVPVKESLPTGYTYPVVDAGQPHPTIENFMNELNNNATFRVYKVQGNDRSISGNEIPENDITEKLLEEYNKYEETKEAWEDSLFDVSYQVYEFEGQDVYSDPYHVMSSNDYFKDGIPYRIGATLEFNDAANYKFDECVCKNTYYLDYTNLKNIYTKDGLLCDSSKLDNYYFGFAEPTLKKMGTKAFTIEIDSSKAPHEKTYEGKGFDVSEFEKDYIKLVDVNTKTPISDNSIKLSYKWESSRYGSMLSEKSFPDADEYTLYVGFEGDETYSFCNYVSDKEPFVIKKRDLTITLPVKEDIVAGYYYGDNNAAVVADIKKPDAITGYIEEDADAFGNGVIEDAKIFTDFNISTSKTSSYEMFLPYGKKTKLYMWQYDYYNSTDIVIESEDDLILNDHYLFDRNAENYNLIIKNDEVVANIHGRSRVYYNYYDSAISTKLLTEYVDYSTSIYPLEGIPYCYNLTDIDGNKLKKCNYLTFIIELPTEYHYSYSEAKDGALYRNQIEANGGYVLSDGSADKIVVAFPVYEKTKSYSFNIQWESDFVETFKIDLKDKQLEADLQEAVAPKSLAFNGVNKKMYVGDTQALDVVIKKVQLNDIVYLNYEVTQGKEYVSVTKETGVVTALKAGNAGKAGQATISVYPVRLNADLEIEKIPNFKPVVVKITVNDVTAPKIISTYPYDDCVEVKYVVPDNGYRREIYVVEGENKTSKEIDKIIDNLGTGKFPGEVVYINGEDYDSKTKACTVVVDNLTPDKKYTVYVRNVSGIRNVDNGENDKSEVAKSVAGNTAQFTTHRPQLNDLFIEFPDKKKVTEYFDEDGDLQSTSVKLDTGKIETKINGEFKMSDSDDSADEYDDIILDLPLNAKYAKKYCDHLNLSYYAIDNSKGSKSKSQLAKGDGYSVLINNRYYVPSKLASIDKKGNVTLKGIGTVRLFVVDNVTKIVKYRDITIVSDVAKLKSKNITMKQGDYVDLYDYITFTSKSGKKLTGKAALKNYFPITISSKDDSIVSDEYGIIHATKANKKSIKVDVCLANNSSVKTTIYVTTKALDGVKKLKAVDIVNNQADFTFTYAGTSYGTISAFRVELRDERKRLVSSELRYCDYDLSNSDNLYSEWNYSKDDSVIFINPKETKVEKGVWGYRFKVKGLERLSKYSVDVLPVYEKNTGKAMSVKFKTTNIPASYNNLSSTAYDSGLNIYVRNDGKGTATATAMRSMGYYMSGNVYTLVADQEDGNAYAFIRKTDKLVWKSTDSKVATVKALPGNMEATLVAKKPGETKIEVKSGITNKIVARYYVRVKAVGNAGPNAYVDREPESQILPFDMEYDQGIEVITEANPVRFTTKNGAFDYRWVSFTAPYDGKYYFSPVNGHGSISGFYYLSEANMANATPVNSDPTTGIELSESQKIYIKVNGTSKNSYAHITVEGENKTLKLSVNKPVYVEKGDSAKFIVPEDDFYIFGSSVEDVKASINGGAKEFLDNEKNTLGEANIKAFTGGAEVKISDFEIPYTEFKGTELSVRKAAKETISTSDTTHQLKAGQYKMLKYVAPMDCIGTLKISANSTECMSVQVYETVNSPVPVNFTDGVASVDLKLVEKQPIWIKMENTSKILKPITVDVVTSIKLEVVQEVNVGVSKDITVNKNKNAIVKFSVPENEREYSFTIKEEKGNTVTAVFSYNGTDNLINTRNWHISSFEDYPVDGEKPLKKGSVIFIEIRTGNSTDDSTKVTVTVNETKATEVKLSEAKKIKVKGNKKEFLSLGYTEPGIYKLSAEVTPKAEGVTHDVSFYEGDKDNYNIYDVPSYEYATHRYEPFIYKRDSDETGKCEGYFEVTEETISSKPYFALCPYGSYDNDLESEVTILCEKVTPATLPEGEITLKPYEIKFFEYIPKTRDAYIFNWDNENITFRYGKKLNSIDETVECPFGHLQSSAKYYFMAKNTMSTEQKVTISPLVPASNELPVGKEFRISSNGIYNFYKHSFAKKSRYSISYEIKDKDNTNLLDSIYDENDNDRTSYFYPREFISSKAGTQAYFQFAAEDKTTLDPVPADITVKIEEIVPKALPSGDIEIKAGSRYWYKYVVPETGRYDITVENHGIPVRYENADNWPFNNTNLSYVLSNETARMLNKGDCYYILVNNAGSDADGTVNISFKQITGTEITLGNPSNKVKLEKGTTKWYILKDVKKGGYEFSFLPDDKAGNAIKTLYYGTTIYGLYTYKTQSVFINQNYPSVYIMVENTSEEDIEDFQVNVKSAQTITLEEKANVINGTSGKRTYGVFVPKATGYYSVYAYDLSENISAFNASLEELNENIHPYLYQYRKLTIGKEYYFTTNVSKRTDEDPDEVSYKLEIKKINVKEISTGETKITAKRDYKYWFRFKAPQDGTYKFEIDGGEVKAVANKVGENFYIKSASVGEEETFALNDNGRELEFVVYYDNLKAGTEVPLESEISIKVTKVD